jgi:hypothetical protein
LGWTNLLSAKKISRLKYRTRKASSAVSLQVLATSGNTSNTAVVWYVLVAGSRASFAVLETDPVAWIPPLSRLFKQHVWLYNAQHLSWRLFLVYAGMYPAPAYVWRAMRLGICSAQAIESYIQKRKHCINEQSFHKRYETHHG